MLCKTERFMRKLCMLFAVLGVFAAVLAAAAPPSAPNLDKQKLAAYLRYAEGFTNGVQIDVGDPVPSSVAGYYRVTAHLTMGTTKADRVYYVTSDGEHVIAGTVWDMKQSPFADTLRHVPDNGPSFGPKDAKVTIVVFSDFECPYCRAFAKTIRENIPKKYPQDVRVVFEDFPIESIHKWARAAAEAAHCVADQDTNAFWQFHDWLFEHQQDVNESNVREKTVDFAKAHNLDAMKIGSCIDTHANAPVVERNVAAGRALQVEQTPTVFVNGRTIGGAVPWSTMDSVIQMELNRPKEIPEAINRNCCAVPVPTITAR